MHTLNYLKAVKDGHLHFADGSTQGIPHWGDPDWMHIFCVRHAEKEDGLADPELNAMGDARAEHLGRILSEAGLDAVYSTPTRRTRLTAEPVQRRAFLEPVEMYEPEDQETWLLELLADNMGKKVLIVGHQHNIPHLLNQLKGGGFAFEHISGYDYGRFFVAATQGIGATEVLEARY